MDERVPCGQSEAEVAARQIAIERDELRMMPDLEEKELALILEVKGTLAGDCARVCGGDDARSDACARDRSRRSWEFRPPP